VIADCVTALGGIPVRVDGWGLDAVYSGSQKCLSCPPGLSPVTFGEAAVKVITTRSSPIQSWFSDMNLIMGYWGSAQRRSYHHTAPVNALYGLHEALLILREEGLERLGSPPPAPPRPQGGLKVSGQTVPHSTPSRSRRRRRARVGDGCSRAQHRDRGRAGRLAGKVWRIGLIDTAAN
jgi:alanine-glyoxylate transaminase/serine-glyoxylate transaminase/serine-pyruvate transaminase